MMASCLFNANLIPRTSTLVRRIRLPSTSPRRHETVDASNLPHRSPYEELKVELDINSSRENPMKVSAYGDERTVACVCDDMHFMTLKKGPPVRCKCGYWFQLIDAKKFWERPSQASS